ncbi:MAG: hypothetical protein ACO3BD_06355 [Chitinophagaceae bacterium]
MKHHKASYYIPLFVFWSICSTAVFAFRQSLESTGFDVKVLLTGNVYLFVLCVISLYMHINGFFHPRTQAFLRSVYGTMMLKMFLTAAVILIYAFFAGRQLNSPAVFSGMGLYFVYTFLELRVVFALLKQQKKS